MTKGFFKEEGLDALMVQMRAPVAMPALVNGDTHYALAGLPTFNAIVQGLPFKFIAIMAEKSLHQLVARPEIKSVMDLKGKRLGISRIGGQDHLQAEAILQAKGIEPKDIKLVNLGAEEPVRGEILRQGLVDVICVSPPHPMRLQKEGYQIVGGPKDLKQGPPSAGVSTTDMRLQSEREETKRVLRAIVRGLRFVRERQEETIPIMMQWLGQNRDIATESYELVAPLLSRDGATSDANLQYAIEAVKKTVGSAKSIPLSQVRDYSILREVQKELGIQ